jgi:glycosyltransferase involved in cell wall biosynthesis
LESLRHVENWDSLVVSYGHNPQLWYQLVRILIAVDPELPVPPRTYGGIERIAAGLVKALRLRGHELGLVAHRSSSCQASAFYPWPGSHSRHQIDAMRNMRLLRHAVNAFQPDVLHSFSRLLYMLPLMRRSLQKIMSYQREPTPHTVRFGSMLADGSLTFTGCSEYICSRGRRGGGKWRAIHNFVDTNLYNFQPNVAKDAPLVFLSRVERIKGAHVAIAAARRMGRRLIIAGNHGSSGSEFHYWAQEIMPQLGGLIEYVGPIDDQQKNTILGQAAALIVPIEWNEPFGLVFAEALACGTPIISCPRGALLEIVRPGIEGFLVNSVKEACDAIATLDKIDRSACRRRAEDSFSAAVITAQYERLYNECLMCG